MKIPNDLWSGVKNHVFTGNWMAKKHSDISKNLGEGSPCLKFYHNFMATIEEKPVLGALLGLIDGLCHGACELARRGSAKLFTKEEDKTTNTFNQIVNTTRNASEKIADCIRSGDNETIKSLLKQGVDPNEEGPFLGGTPLTMASFYKHFEIIPLLLEAGADVDKADRIGVTPLIAATSAGHIDSVKLLLENKADVNKVNQYRETPLYIATFQGWVEIVKLLLENKADVSIPDQHGQTPLHIAVSKGNVKIVKLLLENKANVYQIDKNGETPLHIARSKGYSKIAELLRKAF